MDIENKFEIESIFSVDLENKKKDKIIKTKKILKNASENMRKMAMDKMMKKMGDC